MIFLIIFILVAAACVAYGNAHGEGNMDAPVPPVVGCACGDAVYGKELKIWRHSWNPECPVHLTRW